MRSLLITGANRGIGLEFVKQILAHPTAAPEILIATARNPSAAKDLQEIAKKDKRLHILELDVDNFNVYPSFVAKVSEIVGDKGLTVLFNNAGTLVLRDGTLEDCVNLEMLMKQLNTNAIAPILLTKAFLPLLKKAAAANSDKEFGIHKAAILFTSSYLASISSNQGERAGNFWGYRESKAALNMAARTITKEVKGDGVAVLLLHPGWVMTDLGGKDALVTPQESISGLIKVILALNEKTNGGYIKYTGETLPW